MRQLKILCFAAVVATALMGLAASASASVLCKTSTNTTACPEIYSAGQALEASSSGSAVLETLGGTVLDTCTGSTLKGKTTNSGNGSEVVAATVEGLTWTGCTKTTDTLTNGSLKLDWISGTDNGTLTGSSTQWTTNTIFGSCTYGFGTSLDLGTVTAGSPATISVNTIVAKTAGSAFCPSEARWKASYTFTAPSSYLGLAKEEGAPESQPAVFFEAAEYTATISGEQTKVHLLTLDGVAIECKQATFSGELEYAAETLALTPAYAECTASSSGVTIEPNGCQYVFKPGKETGTNQFTGTQDISCPSGKSLVVTAAEKTCEATIGSQTGLSSVTYHDEVEATPDDVGAEQSLSGIHYTVTKDESSCPFSGKGEKTNGSLEGVSTLKATWNEEAARLVVAQVKSTTLCKEPADAKGNCPAGQAMTLKENPVKGQLPANKTISLLEAKAAANWVTCSQSTVSFETKEEVGKPSIKLANLSIAFAGCEIEVNGVLTQCTVKMEHAPTTGIVTAIAPGGVVQVQITLKINCGTVMEECEYKENPLKTDLSRLRFLGGNPATLQPGVPELSNVAGKKCWGGVVWSADKWEVTAPKPIYVTF